MSKRQPKRRAIFLDRDGVINHPPIRRYIHTWEEFRFLPGVLQALRRLAQKEEIVVVVSNQSGVGRGALGLSQLRGITQRMCQEVRKAGGRIHAVYYCTHPPQEGCPCRKPRSGMLLAAAKRFSIDLTRSYMVGDQETDIRMGRHAGCQTILVLSGKSSRRKAKQLAVTPERTLKDLAAAVLWILRR